MEPDLNAIQGCVDNTWHIALARQLKRLKVFISINESSRAGLPAVQNNHLCDYMHSHCSPCKVKVLGTPPPPPNAWRLCNLDSKSYPRDIQILFFMLYHACSRYHQPYEFSVNKWS